MSYWVRWKTEINIHGFVIKVGESPTSEVLNNTFHFVLLKWNNKDINTDDLGYNIIEGTE